MTTEVFSKLDDYQHARLRTEMYMGSREEHTQEILHFDGTALSMKEFTWVPALYTGFRELVDNAMDELVGHGFGDTLKIDYDPETMVMSVEDNGRGVPIEEKPELGKGPAASILLGDAKSGRNFGERKAVGGLNGIGAATVNFTSEWFQLDVWRGGKHFRQKWIEGTYRGKEIHKTTGHTITKGSKGRTGTRIQVKPSSKVYSNMKLPIEFIESRIWDLVVANPKLKIYLNGTKYQIKNTRDSIRGTYFMDRSVGTIEIKEEGFDSRFYICPNFHDGPEIIHSVVNNIPMFEGGGHIDGFRNVFYSSVIQNLEKRAKKEKLELKRADISMGCLVVNFTTMDDPKFSPQEKTKLISNVQGKIKSGFSELDVKSMLRRNPEWVEEILTRCRNRSNAKDQRDVDSTQKKLKKKKVASLKDATGRNRSACTLFLGEGESAINGMVEVRDSSIHGSMGLRGKILNVYGVTPKRALESSVLVDIMNAIGLEIGTKPNRNSLRYGSVYIATDEDEDGKNITALLVNFLYNYWPSLFEDPDSPFVYKFSTPFIIMTKGKERKYVYAHDYEKFQKNSLAGKYKGYKIIRAKGLGRLTKVDWVNVLKNPVLIPILDDDDLKDNLDLIFNKARADDRKEWLG